MQVNPMFWCFFNAAVQCLSHTPGLAQVSRNLRMRVRFRVGVVVRVMVRVSCTLLNARHSMHHATLHPIP